MISARPLVPRHCPSVTNHAPQMKNWRNIITDSLVRIVEVIVGLQALPPEVCDEKPRNSPKLQGPGVTGGHKGNRRARPVNRFFRHKRSPFGRLSTPGKTPSGDFSEKPLFPPTSPGSPILGGL